MEESFAQVIISISAKEVDRAFTYAIPQNLRDKVSLGVRVVVPFGKSNKKFEGYVVGIQDSRPPGEIDFKSIIEVIGDKALFSGEMLQLALWMSDKYFTPYAECLKCIMPSGLAYKSRNIYQVTGEAAYLSPKQEQVYNYLLDSGGSGEKSELAKAFGQNVLAVLNSLVSKGVLSQKQEGAARDLAQKIRFIRLKKGMEEEIGCLTKTDSKQSQVLNLLKHGEISVKDARIKLCITESPIKSLVQKGLIEIFEKEVRRSAINYSTYKEQGPFTLTQEQEAAVLAITEILDEKEPQQPVLIHGVTGSGKTEVYLRIIEKVLASGKQAIVLVPEISLTPQTVERFINRFGERVSVTHSRLSSAQRYDQWKNAAEGRVSVMVGPRSAVFAPFSNLGIIVIDEEHEHTYKSETSPKYDAKEVAIKRAEMNGALVVLGSATPSVASYYKAENKEYRLINMNTRINSQMPHIEIVDMRRELQAGNRSIFSRSLLEAMNYNVEKGFQIILFLNRRGHSTFVSCRQCGYVVKCDDCNINYTYHLYTDKLICHYCGKTAENPKNCPQCGSKYIKYFGVGTQKIEEEIRSIMPHVPVMRMDMDATTGKDSHERLFTSFRKGEAQILIGTQMIAKGLDFPKVTLVGVVAADVSLNASDYRSGERTFELLTQVSGRAGRAEKPGHVIIQTYNPDHYSIAYTKEYDYTGYYQHEIALRRQMKYPPFTHVFTTLLSGELEKKIIMALYKLCDIIQAYNKEGEFEVLGPAPAFISKINKKYRWKLIVICQDEIRLKNFMLHSIDRLKKEGDVVDITINLTLNPQVSV